MSKLRYYWFAIRWLYRNRSCNNARQTNRARVGGYAIHDIEKKTPTGRETMKRYRFSRAELEELGGQPVFMTGAKPGEDHDGIWGIVSVIYQRVSDGFGVTRDFADYGRTWEAWNAE